MNAVKEQPKSGARRIENGKVYIFDQGRWQLSEYDTRNFQRHGFQMNKELKVEGRKVYVFDQGRWQFSEYETRKYHRHGVAM